MIRTAVAALAATGALLVPAASASASAGASAGWQPAAGWQAGGPPILHAPPARSPQLQNDPPWRAAPILISGAAAYRDGEYLYQDYLDDDRGAGSGTAGTATPSGTYEYPADPVYGDNAADIVEVRLKLLRHALALRITFNTMHDPSLVAATIALGGTPGVTYPLPHDAGVREPAQVFVTVHGHSGDIVDAATGRTLATAPAVFPTLFRRQLDVRVPYTVFDPRGKTFRVAAASGLWDAAKGTYLQPGPTATAATPGGDGSGPDGTTQIPAIVNVAFRFGEPQVHTNPWREDAQAAALTAGDLSPFYATVDARKLAAGVTDNVLGQPDGTPANGFLDRIMVSHFEDQQGRGAPIATIQQIIANTVPVGCGGSGNPCELSGRLEPYMVYVPSGPAPRDGWGVTLDLHNCNQTYNVRTGTAAVTVFGDRQPGRSLVFTPEARGSCYWYYGEAGADVFEAWADLAARYPVDEREADITGTSMGGYGAYKFAALYPDLFARASAVVGCVSAGVLWPGAPATPPGGQGSLIYPMLASLRDLPIMSWNGSADNLCVYSDQQPVSQRLDALRYRYSFWTFTGAGHTNLSPDRTPMAGFFGDARVDPDPAHITYVVNQSMSEPAYGLDAGHAYWISGMRLRDTGVTPPEGTADVRSEGFGMGDAPVLPTATITGVLPPASSDNSQLPSYPYTEQSKSWGPPAAAPPADVLDIIATNIASMTIDVARARVDCHVHLNVTSDGPVSIDLLGCPGPRHDFGRHASLTTAPLLPTRLGTTTSYDSIAREGSMKIGFAGRAFVLVILGSVFVTPARAVAADRPWMNPSLPPAVRAELVLRQMTEDEKFAMLHGAPGTVAGPARLGIPSLLPSDGALGVTHTSGATQFPDAEALAGSFDRSLAGEYGVALGQEQFNKRHNVVLGPTVNILRVPQWGRAFETYSEDPFLSAQTVVADIQGIQAQHVLTTAKHYAGNNQEIQRGTNGDAVGVNDVVSDQALHEIYLPAFEAAIKDARSGGVMCAYNKVNGDYACENSYLLNTVLRDEWHFDGPVMSDWGATHSTAKAGNAGLDIEEPSGVFFSPANLQAALASGEITQATIDNMVLHILTAMFRIGLVDNPLPATASATVSTPAHQELATGISENGSVLLKNVRGVLPLSGRDRSIAVIGDDADAHPQTQANPPSSSAYVSASHAPVSPLSAITARAPQGTSVTFSQGTLGVGALPPIPASALTPSSGTGNGLTGTYYPSLDFTGTPIGTGTVPNPDFNANPSPVPANATWSGIWTGTITAPADGDYRFSMAAGGPAHLAIDGTTVITYRDPRYGTVQPGNELVQDGLIHLTAGPHKIRVDYATTGSPGFFGGGLHVGWQPQEDKLINAAADAARSADVAVVFASNLTSEGMDRSALALPADQDKLISAVAAANPHTVVVLNTSGPVLMPWINSVAGAIEAWYPGENDGTAIASLLYGDVNPSGHLPVTFPRDNSQGPLKTTLEYPGNGIDVRYDEGILEGYRWYDAKGETPLFPFGYGLSYTTFAFSHLAVRPDASGGVKVSFDITNTGSRTGAAVPQVYVGPGPEVPGVQQAVRSLRGYDKVMLVPGETSRVSIPLDPRSFQYWSTAAGDWATDYGPRTIWVGDADAPARLPLSAAFTLRPRGHHH